MPQDIISFDDIHSKIHTIRGVPVMLDSDLAHLYGIETKYINRAMKRNIERFPSYFCFQITAEEYKASRCQDGTLNLSEVGRGTNIKYLPYVYSEQGVAMLSAVLRSDSAIQISISIINAFVSMRHFISDNTLVFQRLDRIELKQLEADEKFAKIFKQLETPKPGKAVIFFKGQMWDATSCIEEIISNAGSSITLIDGYVDRRTLDMLSGKKSGVKVIIHTDRKHCSLTEKEITDFNSQYGPLEIRFTDEFHDRFLILDDKELYHIGASIKDAGKKAFEISLNEDRKILEAILARIE